MRLWVWPVIGMLALSGPAFGGKKKDKDKAPAPAEAVELSPGEDAVARANEEVAKGEVELAIDILRQATKKEGMTGEPFLRLGQLLEDTMDMVQAVEAYKTAADRSSGPQKAEALARTSLVQELNGALAEANTAGEAAAEADPESAWAAIALSRARARQGKGDEALTLAEKARGLGDAAALTTVGFAQEARHDFPAAEAAYRGALEAEPSRPMANLGLARVLRQTGRATEADPLLARVTEAAPWLLEAYKESVQVKIALGQFIPAMEQAQTYAALAGEDPMSSKVVDEVKLAQALDYVSRGQAELAIEDLTHLLEQKPDLVAARIGLAKAYISKSRSDKTQIDVALAELEKAIATDPNAAEAYFQTGVIQQDLKGDAAKALPSFEKAVELDPNTAEYAIRYGNALSGQKQGAKAIEVLSKTVAGPAASRPDAWTYLSGAHLVAGQYEDAIRTGIKAIELLDAMDETPISKSVRGMVCDYLAWAYINKKDRDNAIKYGSQARSLGIKDPDLFKRVSDLEGGMQFAGEETKKPAPRKPRRRR